MKLAAKEFKTVATKGGKQYVEVKERLQYLASEFVGEYSITTDYQYFSERKMWAVKATLTLTADGVTSTYTGLAQEIESEKFGTVNFTSALENAETSAVGRACAMAGIGIDISIASADEINKAHARPQEMATLSDACFEALTAATITDLKAVVTNYRQDFGGNPTFRMAAEARKAQLAPAASPTLPKYATEAQQAHLLKLLKSHHNAGLRDYATGRISDKQPMDECSELIESAMTNINMKAGDGPALADDNSLESHV